VDRFPQRVLVITQVGAPLSRFRRPVGGDTSSSSDAQSRELGAPAK